MISSPPPSHPVHWFAHSVLGQQVLCEEQHLLQSLYPQLFGFHALQIGGVGQGQLLQGMRLGHQCLVSVPELPALPDICGLHSEADALPFAADSVDLVLLPHVLEFSGNSHGILRETERILVAEGHLLLLGFNPLGWWGLWRLFKHRHQPPWNAQFLALMRVKDWLSLLGFEILSQQACCFSPPFQNPHLMRTLGWLGAIERRWLPLGGVYVLLAKKRRLYMPRVRPHWLLGAAKDKNLIGAASQTASPTARQTKS